MSYIWNRIENQKWKTITKSYVFLLISTAISGVVGFLLWEVFHFVILNGLDWMICFIGYSGTIGWLTSLF